ncbi:putative toxin-antitoxin system toxin component, PIN family [candidate division KSB1 bacterium]|nr:putative toxin-antitoxin system toxin component, PIN family [candidate division KSB1 bacterium]
MPKRKISRVIIDTNLWISFLIGRKLRTLKKLIVNQNIEIIMTEQLLQEIEIVTSRPKFRQYFDQNKIHELIRFLKLITTIIPIISDIQQCRDPKDNFLLSLAVDSHADYLLTGDRDLLEIGHIKSTKIISVSDFEQLFST